MPLMDLSSRSRNKKGQLKANIPSCLTGGNCMRRSFKFFSSGMWPQCFSSSWDIGIVLIVNEPPSQLLILEVGGECCVEIVILLHVTSMYEMLWYIEVFLELGYESARKPEGEDQPFPPADFVVRCYLPKLASQAATFRQCSVEDAIPFIHMLGVGTRTPLTKRNFITGHGTGVDKFALSKPGDVPPERESANKRCNSFSSVSNPILISHPITSSLHPIISSVCVVIRAS